MKTKLLSILMVLLLAFTSFAAPIVTVQINWSYPPPNVSRFQLLSSPNNGATWNVITNLPPRTFQAFYTYVKNNNLTFQVRPYTNAIVNTTIGLVWFPSPSTSIAGYHVYWGPNSGNYTNFINVGNVTNTTFTGRSGVNYFLNVTAYDSVGLESSYDGQVLWQAPYGPEAGFAIITPTVKGVSRSGVVGTVSY